MAMPTSTSAGTDLAEVILNRQNVALARSQRLVQSWLPRKPSTSADMATGGAEKPDEDEFEEGMDELSGVGYKRPADDGSEVGVLGGLKRRRIGAAEDKLMEQLLGKKVAAERRKAVDAKKGKAEGMAKYKRNSKEVEGKRVETRREAIEEDEEEEEGRAAKFTSKKRKVVSSSNGKAAGADGDKDASSETDVAPASSKERRAGNYLDEVLSQHAAKSNRKKSKKKGRLKMSSENVAT